MRSWTDELENEAVIVVISGDPGSETIKTVRETRITFPYLSDPGLQVSAQFDMLPQPGQPMGNMTGVAQMGYVIVDEAGVIRLQRVDIYFGTHADQILATLRGV